MLPRIKRADLKKLLAGGCSAEGCTEKHEAMELYLRSQCHPDHRGVGAVIAEEATVLRLECVVCDAPICVVEVTP